MIDQDIKFNPTILEIIFSNNESLELSLDLIQLLSYHKKNSNSYYASCTYFEVIFKPEVSNIRMNDYTFLERIKWKDISGFSLKDNNMNKYNISIPSKSIGEYSDTNILQKNELLQGGYIRVIVKESI